MKSCANCKYKAIERLLCIICSGFNGWEPKDEQTRIMEDFKEVCVL